MKVKSVNKKVWKAAEIEELNSKTSYTPATMPIGGPPMPMEYCGGGGGCSSVCCYCGWVGCL